MASLKRQWFFVLVLSFISGVFLASFIHGGIVSIALFLLLMSAVVTGYTFVFVKQAFEQDIRGAFILISIGFLAMSLGLLRFQSATLHPDPTLPYEVGQKVTFVGKVSAEPQEKSGHVQYIVKTPTTGFLVSADPYPVFQYADTVKVSGTLQQPMPFATDDGGTFDYPLYLASEGVSYTIGFPHISLVSSPKFSLERSLFSIKNHFFASLGKVVSYPESGVLSGVLAGDENAIPPDLLADFRLIGLIHIVVLSGYSLTLISDSLAEIFSFLSRKRAIIISMVAIALFVLMVGPKVSIIRAGIMAMVALLAKLTRRTYDIARALALSAFVLVLWNPYMLVADTGFALSFLSVVGLIFLAPKLEPYLKHVPEKFGLRHIVSATLSIQLFLLPLLLYTNGAISVGSLLANLLVLPFLPFIMFFAFLAGIFGFGGPALGFLPGIIAQVSGRYIIFIAQLFNHIPGSIISIHHVSVLVPYICYALFVLYLIYKKIRTRQKATSI